MDPIKITILKSLSLEWDSFGDVSTVGWFAFGYVNGNEIVDVGERSPVRSGEHLDIGWYIVRINDLGNLIAFYFEDYEHAESFFDTAEEELNAAW